MRGASHDSATEEKEPKAKAAKKSAAKGDKADPDDGGE
jgi:hypothetical protein